KQRLDKIEDPLAPNLPSAPTFPYLTEVAMDRLHELDPATAPKRGGQPGGGMNLTPAQIKKLMEQMQKQGGEAPHGGGH
ncbi:MAG TPA: hypothetical protein VM580_17830, partial [Labilithrix sp.]|nr:hypothetical protein [Labilithrix sp.]